MCVLNVMVTHPVDLTITHQKKEEEEPERQQDHNDISSSSHECL